VLKDPRLPELVLERPDEVGPRQPRLPRHDVEVYGLVEVFVDEAAGKLQAHRRARELAGHRPKASRSAGAGTRVSGMPGVRPTWRARPLPPLDRIGRRAEVAQLGRALD
jgi:hypothetical protein